MDLVQEVDLTVALRSGVYLLMLYEEVVYVGKAKKLALRISSHQGVWERARKGQRLAPGQQVIRFNRVRVVPCHEVDLDRLEKELITKHQPRFNRTNGIRKMSLAEAGFDMSRLIGRERIVRRI